MACGLGRRAWTGWHTGAGVLDVPPSDAASTPTNDATSTHAPTPSTEAAPTDDTVKTVETMVKVLTAVLCTVC